jgi:2-phosphoglycerate kinase
MNAHRPDRIIVVRSDYGLPYSKGLMAQSIMGAGLSPERSHGIARRIEQRLDERDDPEVSVDELRALAEQVLLDEEGEAVAKRFRQWGLAERVARPVVILIGGVTGVGKSTIATQLANRLAITRVVATDQVRQVVRAFLSRDFRPAVHYSSFDVARHIPELGEGREATIAGFLRQVADIAPGIDALVERAVSERSKIVIEGVHLLPEVPSARLAVTDEQAHRSHFHMRGMESARPTRRYLEAFDRIRTMQEFLIARAHETGTPVVDEGSLEPALTRVMEVVLDEIAAQTADADAGAKVLGEQ